MKSLLLPFYMVKLLLYSWLAHCLCPGNINVGLYLPKYHFRPDFHLLKNTYYYSLLVLDFLINLLECFHSGPKPLIKLKILL